jgi:hypothetical protein
MGAAPERRSTSSARLWRELASFGMFKPVWTDFKPTDCNLYAIVGEPSLVVANYASQKTLLDCSSFDNSPIAR